MYLSLTTQDCILIVVELIKQSMSSMISSPARGSDNYSVVDTVTYGTIIELTATVRSKYRPDL